VTTGAVLEVAIAAFLLPVNGRWRGNCMPALQPDDVVVADSAMLWLALVRSANALMPCFIMRVTVIFVAGRSWALVTILSGGNVLSSNPHSMARTELLRRLPSKHAGAGNMY